MVGLCACTGTCTEEREGRCGLGGVRRERVSVCAGEDEADKELCKQAGADTVPLTRVSGLGEARQVPLQGSMQVVLGKTQGSSWFAVLGGVMWGAWVCVQGQERLCKRRGGTCPSAASP